jgi:hypothetical protein
MIAGANPLVIVIYPSDSNVRHPETVLIRDFLAVAATGIRTGAEGNSLAGNKAPYPLGFSMS